ncbi:MAG: hypothetical protein IMY67_05110 [Bacteroidetes bacterium]|nr:hypothetical protein [Bacteroidota bacterium]
MTDIETTIIIAMAAVLAAFVTGILSLVNLIISKDIKISELRQNWINSLREEVSSFIATANSVSAEWKCHPDKTDGVNFISKNIELIHKLDTLSHKIRLRLNPKEHEDTITLVNDIERLLSSPVQINNSNNLMLYFEKLNTQTQNILKEEWKRVKSGEPSYKILKVTSIIFLITILITSKYIYTHI